MATGTVKWFSDDKGFGFITPDEGSRDLFVHHTGIVADGFRTLSEGARVRVRGGAGRQGAEGGPGREALNNEHRFTRKARSSERAFRRRYVRRTTRMMMISNVPRPMYMSVSFGQ